MNTDSNAPGTEDQVSDESGLVDDSYAPEGMREKLDDEVAEVNDGGGASTDSESDPTGDQAPQGLADADREGAGEVEKVSNPADVDSGGDAGGASETDSPPGDTGAVTEAPD